MQVKKNLYSFLSKCIREGLKWFQKSIDFLRQETIIATSVGDYQISTSPFFPLCKWQIFWMIFTSEFKNPCLTHTELCGNDRTLNLTIDCLIFHIFKYILWTRLILPIFVKYGLISGFFSVTTLQRGWQRRQSPHTAHG